MEKIQNCYYSRPLEKIRNLCLEISVNKEKEPYSRMHFPTVFLVTHFNEKYAEGLEDYNHILCYGISFFRKQAKVKLMK